MRSQKRLTWRELETQRLANLTPEEMDTFNKDVAEARRRLELAGLVYNARHQAGLTQIELANIAGTHQSAIAQIEKGARVPEIVTLDRLAAALGYELEITMTKAA